MASVTLCRANWNSRQRLRTGGGFVGQVVAPGGNGASYANQFLAQQCHKQLSIQPSPAALIILFWNMAQLNERFETLETQLDLPAQSIALQHLLGRNSILRQGGEHQ